MRSENLNGHALNGFKKRGLPRVEPVAPPHSPEAETGALACVLIAGDSGSQAEVDALLMQLRPRLFYVVANRGLCEAMTLMRMEGHALDTVTLITWLKGKKLIESCGGLDYIAHLPEMAPSVANFLAYLEILREKTHRRWLLDKSGELRDLAGAETVSIEETQQRLGDLLDATQRVTHKAPPLKIWRAPELQKYKPDPKLRLVGDNEINMGRDGVVVIAGPGSSGKSLCAMSLALAGAIGSGTWMGRKLHRQFKTLVIQAENGSVRLKAEMEALKKNHPAVDIDGHIFVSDPPEGGLPFHHSEFRREVRRAVDDLGVSLVIIDPWSQVAPDEGAKETVDKLNEIRSCFPSGDNCPCTLIIAHTKKPRPEDIRRGRSLVNIVAGSVALVNTSRATYLLLPWSDDMTDDRIYWSCPKLNNGQMYAPTVWHRRFGTFFQHDSLTDPTTWGNSENEEREYRRKLTLAMLKVVFKETKRPGMKRAELAREIHSRYGIGQSTVFRAIGEDGYLADYVTEAAGVVALKDEVRK